MCIDNGIHQNLKSLENLNCNVIFVSIPFSIIIISKIL